MNENVFSAPFAWFPGEAPRARACPADPHPAVSIPRSFRGVPRECAHLPVIPFKKYWNFHVSCKLPEGRRRAEEHPPRGIPRGAVGVREPSRGNLDWSRGTLRAHVKSLYTSGEKSVHLEIHI